MRVTDHPHFNRSRAKALGLKRYKTEKPCPKGHVAERMTVNGRCTACMKEYKLAPENVKRELARLKKCREVNPERYYAAEARRRGKPRHKIDMSFRQRITGVLKEKYKSKSFEKIFGYSKEVLKAHLERQFEEGMSWKNFGKWHIDHIVPVSNFNYSSHTEDDFKFCWALSNLRPLWASENYKKSSIRTHLI